MESDGVRIRAYLDSNSWSLHLAGQRNCWGNSERKVSENISERRVPNQPDSNDHGHVCVILLCCFHSSAKSSSLLCFSLTSLKFQRLFACSLATSNMSTSSHLTLFVALVLIAHSGGVQNINCPHRHCSRHL